MTKRLALAMGFAAVLGTGGGPAAAQQTLQDALIAAYLGNPTLLAERAKLRATDEQVPQALSNWRPTVNFTAAKGASTVYNNTLTGTNQHQHRDGSEWEMKLTQPLFRGGRTLASVEQAEATVKAQRARLMVAEQTVLLNAANAYLDVVRDQATLRLNIGNEQVLRRQREAANDRFRVGELTRTDVFQAEARLARATADRISAEGNLEASRANFRNVVGVAAGQLPPAEMKLPDLPQDLETAVKVALAQNPLVVATDYDEKATIAEVDKVWGELLPTINFEATANRTFEGSSETSRVDEYEAKFNLTVPLYQSGSAYSRLRAARQSVMERRQLFDKQRRDAVQAATRAWRNLETARARTESIMTQIRAADVALEGVEREAAVGSRTVLDVLDAKQEQLDANVNLVRAQRDEQSAHFELLSAMGQLTASQLNLPVDLYDPWRHYDEVRDRWFGGRSSEDNTATE